MRLPPIDTWRLAAAGPWSNPTPASTKPRPPRNTPADAVATFLTKSLRVVIVFLLTPWSLHVRAAIDLERDCSRSRADPLGPPERPDKARPTYCKRPT